jgi:hypothetical protein
MKSLIILLVVIVIAITSFNLDLVSASGCKEISIIFARGSDQNGSQKPSNPLFDDTGTLESEQQTKAFFTQLDKRMINVSKEFISFHNSYQWR